MRGNARARERLLEKRTVLPWCAEQDRHPVEGNAALRLPPDQPRDLHTLAALTGRGEEKHVVAQGRHRVRSFDEQALLHAGERRGGGFRERAGDGPDGARDARLVDGARQRGGQAGLGGDGMELPQTSAELMDPPRAHRFDTERRKRREAARGHRFRSDGGCEPAEREPLPAECGPRHGRAHGVRRGLLCRAHDERAPRWPSLAEQFPRELEPGRCGCGCDQLSHGHTAYPKGPTFPPTFCFATVAPCSCSRCASRTRRWIASRRYPTASPQLARPRSCSPGWRRRTRTACAPMASGRSSATTRSTRI